MLLYISGMLFESMLLALPQVEATAQTTLIARTSLSYWVGT